MPILLTVGRKTNTTGNELGNLPDWAVYNISADPHQDENIADKDSTLLFEMQSLFEAAKR